MVTELQLDLFGDLPQQDKPKRKHNADLAKEPLSVKIDNALRLLRAADGKEPIEVSYSGGKDSDVILELVRMATLPTNARQPDATFNKWRTEALKAYGNAIVPQVMYEIFRAIELVEKAEIAKNPK